MQEHFDVLVVGAGLSGIGAGYHLQKNCPGLSYAILEGRASSGGTWDLFRYPGIRSDSDMFTLGYSFRPWTDAKSIADGPSILDYVRKTASDNGIDSRIRYRHQVKRAAWSSDTARWTVEAEVGGEDGESNEIVRFTGRFLFMCSGYYKYEAGYTPDFPGAESFAGRIVHPQKWTDDVAYEDKHVVVIGSGATAVTLVPELAKRAAHVTMLQRSPTYMLSAPNRDSAANWLRKHLPAKLAYGIVRWRNVLLGMLFFNFSRKRPARVKALLLSQIRKQLDPDYDVDTHFTPHYNPWDQRLCLVTDGDLFQAIREKRVTVVTDHIDSFTEKGISLRSGSELEADLIVTATGLDLQVLGGLEISVDGERVNAADTMTYKGMMYSDVPNMASATGYTNASWTLKCDLTCEYVCRLLNHMESKGYDHCTPRRTDPTVTEEPWVDFSSGYVQRSLDLFAKQGSKKPWRLNQNYALDILSLGYSRLEDGVMEFGKPGSPRRAPVADAPRSRPADSGPPMQPASTSSG